MKYYYTDKELKELMSHVVVLVDTKEKKNQHILDYFDKCGIRYKKKSLKTGDYSLMIEKCPDLGYVMDTLLVDELCIERKGSLEEIAGNFSDSTERFKKELNRMININYVYLLIEDSSVDDLISHNYNTRLNETSFLRTLMTVQKRSNIYLYFVTKEHIGQLIFEICRSCLMNNILKS